MTTPPNTAPTPELAAKAALEDADDGMTSTPTRVRIYSQEYGDDACWTLDGADDDGRYTEDVWRYPTHAEAVAAMPEFVAFQVEHLAAFGFEWKWRQHRPTAAERAALIARNAK